jgi:hypothetical protein
MQAPTAAVLEPLAYLPPYADVCSVCFRMPPYASYAQCLSRLLCGARGGLALAFKSEYQGAAPRAVRLSLSTPLSLYASLSLYTRLSPYASLSIRLSLYTPLSLYASLSIRLSLYTPLSNPLSLVYEPLAYSCTRPSAASVCGLKVLVYAGLSRRSVREEYGALSLRRSLSLSLRRSLTTPLSLCCALSLRLSLSALLSLRRSKGLRLLVYEAFSC